MKRSLVVLAAASASLASAQLSPSGATASFRGSLPPKPVAALSEDQEAAIQATLEDVTESFASVRKHPRAADADIFLKAVRYALEFDEWYDKKPEDGVKKAAALLEEAKRRIESLKKNETPWMSGSGQKVLGFYSNIDDSPQPYGVEVPDGLEWGEGKKAVSMWVWLHGRGDTATDLHFIYSRLAAKKPGQFQPAGAIVIHPFGRYCNGYKSAGETDVFEARNDAIARFHVDRDRIALAGFSMGGAGAWHIGAHFADQWACVHAGAGFVDVKRYQELTPDKMPPWHEQKLWGAYDVPCYARNFFNVPLIVYSGENDSQRDSAEYMSEVLSKEGHTMKHLVGPGMGHKYHPEVIKDVQRLIEEAVAKGREPWPRKVSLQTRTVAYGAISKWVGITRLDEHWNESRLDAEWNAQLQTITIATKGVAAFWAKAPPEREARLVVDGQAVPKYPSLGGGNFWHLVKLHGNWEIDRTAFLVAPKTALMGPIDDGFRGRFVVVLPENEAMHPEVESWMKGEGTRFIRRWRSLMRGDPIVKRSADVSEEDMTRCNLVLWGDPQSNVLIKRLTQGRSDVPGFPLKWDRDYLEIAGNRVSAPSHVPVLCYPNLLSTPWGVRYVILNSGLTFREAHDRTNSLQNPKLPDWAILDITQPPNAESAGRVVAADFFDENWQVKNTKQPSP